MLDILVEILDGLVKVPCAYRDRVEKVFEEYLLQVKFLLDDFAPIEVDFVIRWFPVTEKHGWDGFGKSISAVSSNATPATSERIATNFTECG